MNNFFTLAERSPAQPAARTAAAHSPPGGRAKIGEPEGPEFFEELERARKRRAEEELPAGTAALPALQDNSFQPPVELVTPEEDGVQDAGASEEGDPARALQEAMEGAMANAMSEVTAASGQVKPQQTPQVGTAVEAGSVQAGVQVAPLPEAAAADGLSVASQVVDATIPEGDEQAQPVTATFTPPPDTPPSSMELGAAASGHLLETDSAVDAEAAPRMQETRQQTVAAEDVSRANPQPAPAEERREAGARTDQENNSQQSSRGTAVGEAYAAVEQTTQATSTTGTQGAQALESARMAEAQEPQLASQISKAVLEMNRNGESILRLQLSPENLGTITLQVLKGSDGLRVWMSAELPATAALLESKQMDLQGALQVNGVQLAGLVIGQGAAQDQAANWGRWQFRKQASRSGGGLQSGDEPPGTEVPVRRVQSESMVDYLI